MSNLEKYKTACNYQVAVDDTAVERALREYVAALKIERDVVKLQRGWTVDTYPALKASVFAILRDFKKRIGDAAKTAPKSTKSPQEALHSFTQWCIFRSGWWSGDLSWLAITYFGAEEKNLPEVKAWSKPVLDAFLAGAWILYWTEDTVFWVQHPVAKLDRDNRLHCEDGPALINDVEDLYLWHGVSVPRHWIEDRANLNPAEVLAVENVEQRAAGVAIAGMARMQSVLDCKVIDTHPHPEIGELVEVSLPGIERPGRYLRALCPRNGQIFEAVPYVSDIDGLPIETALAAQAWRIGDPQSEYEIPPRRT